MFGHQQERALDELLYLLLDGDCAIEESSELLAYIGAQGRMRGCHLGKVDEGFPETIHLVLQHAFLLPFLMRGKKSIVSNHCGFTKKGRI